MILLLLSLRDLSPVNKIGRYLKSGSIMRYPYIRYVSSTSLSTYTYTFPIILHIHIHLYQKKEKKKRLSQNNLNLPPTTPLLHLQPPNKNLSPRILPRMPHDPLPINRHIQPSRRQQPKRSMTPQNLSLPGIRASNILRSGILHIIFLTRVTITAEK